MFTRLIILKWEVLTIGAIIAVGIDAASRRGFIRIPSFRWVRPFMLFGLSVIVSALAAHNHHDAAKHAFRLCALVLLCGLIQRSQISTSRIWYLIRISVVTASLVGCVGLWIGMAAAYRGEFNLWSMFVTFRNPNLAAQYLVAIVPLAFAVVARSEGGVRRILWLAAAAVISIVLVATKSRGAYIAACVGTLVSIAYVASGRGWLGKRIVKKAVPVAALLLILALGITLVAFLPRMLRSKQEMLRPHLWTCAARMIASSPVIGVGPGNFAVRFGGFEGYRGQWAPGPEFRVRYAHSDYLQIGAEYGLVALIAIGCLVLRPTIALCRAYRRNMDGSELWTGGAALGSVVGVLVHSLVSFPLLMPASALCFWLCLGVVGALAEPAARNTRSAPGVAATRETLERSLALPPRPVWIALCVGCVIAAAAMPLRFLMSDFYLARSKAAANAGKAAQQKGDKQLSRYYASAAASSVEESLRYDINNRTAWFQKGLVSTATRNYEDAVLAYRQAIALLPDYHTQHHNLGHVYVRMDDDPAAEAEFHKALAIHPRYTLAHKALGDLYRRRGDNERKEAEELSRRVTQWREAVEGGVASTALQLATEICGSIPSSPLQPAYLRLCKKNGINSEYLEAGFNTWDFQSWRHAFVLKKLAQRVVSQAEENHPPISALFTAVRERIEPSEPPKGNILWPYTVWRLRKGVCDRQAWVLCELAYQLGYETQIVYFRNPKTSVSPHTICEIRRGNEKWVADPYSGKFLPNVSVADLAADTQLVASTWPDKEDWQEAIKKSAYLLPAYPQDYCQRNQLLRHKVQHILGEHCPRFGQSPADRLNKYVSLTRQKDRSFPYQFWSYPFRLLRSQMAMAMNRKPREQDNQPDS